MPRQSSNDVADASSPVAVSTVGRARVIHRYLSVAILSLISATCVRDPGRFVMSAQPSQRIYRRGYRLRCLSDGLRSNRELQCSAINMTTWIFGTKRGAGKPLTRLCADIYFNRALIHWIVWFLA
jgi:hypothetical protein